MEAKFSNRVKEVISLSREEALRLGHDYIGTEHLLLGVIREGEGVAIGLLKKLGISLILSISQAQSTSRNQPGCKSTDFRKRKIIQFYF